MSNNRLLRAIGLIFAGSMALISALTLAALSTNRVQADPPAAANRSLLSELP